MNKKSSEDPSFGEWLRQQRRMLDLTQQGLADQVGCARITLRRIEAGALRPSKELALILLEKLGTPPNERDVWLRFARGLSRFPESSSVPFPTQHQTNLPASGTSFIGREKEQAEVLELVSKYRLVTLLGFGGVGKTRLSLKIGDQLLRDYADGIWLVELAPILDPLLVPRSAALAIGLRDEPNRPVIDMLAAYLQKKKMVIILDNCEHVVAACAQLADILLKGCPQLKILATSREALGAFGEIAYQVPSLGLPDLQQMLVKLRDYESVRLFEERAQLAETDFRLTMENASSISQICIQLDGIPLAIELAAARTNILSAEEIAARLQKNFHLLTGGNRTGHPRHQTLQAAIDWSFNLLSLAEQTLFRRLSIFVHSWTLEAAESICSDIKIHAEDVLDLLGQLINKSLVKKEKTSRETRYSMLEVLRQYADEKLIDSDESETMRNKHLAYFLDATELAAPHLIRLEQLHWLAKLDVDYENIRAALEWSFIKESPASSLRLCAALGRYWLIRCYWKEGSRWIGRALAKPIGELTAAEKTARARSLYYDAALAQVLDDLIRMQDAAQASLVLCETGNDLRDIAIARLYVGFALYRLEEFEKAQPLLKQSLNEFRALKDMYWEAYTQRWLSMNSVRLGGQLTHEMFVADVELARHAGERVHLSSALFRLAQWEWENNQIEESEVHLHESEVLCKEIGTINSLAPFLDATILHYSRNDSQKARTLYLSSKEQCELNGENYAKSLVLLHLGILERDEGNLQHAQSYLEEALRLAREFGTKDMVVFRLALLGQIQFLKGNSQLAKQEFGRSFSIANEIEVGGALFIFSNCYATLQPEMAVQVLGAVHANLQNTNGRLDPFFLRETQRTIAQARQFLDEIDFQTAWAVGEKMSLDTAFELALKTVEKL